MWTKSTKANPKMRLVMPRLTPLLFGCNCYLKINECNNNNDDGFIGFSCLYMKLLDELLHPAM
ncbi:hypothetical protein Ocin01_11223 [Orchesella cincta]|uniref:Uncharacterized protein n=1 Tax=Orchesella cincta TaxID=48709 RepID=A0A1D2MRK9_ORCCI|nr:hypothetical protein Ocin01_11223 [Orchesella cincta]